MRMWIVSGVLSKRADRYELCAHTGVYAANSKEEAIGIQVEYLGKNALEYRIESIEANDVTTWARDFFRMFPAKPALIAHEAAPQGFGSLDNRNVDHHSA